MSRIALFLSLLGFIAAASGHDCPSYPASKWSFNPATLQEKLKSERCPLPIIFITARGDIPMAVRAIQGNQRLLDGIGWQNDRGQVLRFLRNPAIEPTNNRAERALRPAVIARKVSQCSKTQSGAEAFAVFTTVIRTLTKKAHTSIAQGLHSLLHPLDTPGVWPSGGPPTRPMSKPASAPGWTSRRCWNIAGDCRFWRICGEG